MLVIFDKEEFEKHAAHNNMASRTISLTAKFPMTKRAKQFTDKWQAHEDEYLRAHHLAMKPAQLAHALGRTKSAVTSRLSKLRLLRSIKPWTKAEEIYLRRNFRHTNNRLLGQELGRSRSAITNRLTILGLRRTIAERNNLKAATRFHQGFVPWNKGKKGLRMSINTEFKKGHLPANTKHDGCITVRVHRRTQIPYKYLRVAKAKWLLLHHYKWEQKHGAIPPHHIVGFKNGNTLDCRLRNLYLMSKAENARRNQNIEKARLGIKRAWQEGRHFQHDRFIANLLAPRDQKLKSLLLNHPQLLQIKRTQLALRRTINEARTQTTR